MVNLTAEFLYNRLQQLRKRVCIWTQWKVFNVIHIWKVLKWLDWNAFHDLESNIDLHLKNALQVVISEHLGRKADKVHSAALLNPNEYQALFPVGQFNVLIGKHPP